MDMRRNLACLGACMLALGTLCAAAQSVPVFDDATEDWDLRHTYGGGDWYVVGGGVAVFDCDHDGFAEALLAGGESPLAFLKNEGGMRFVDQTASLGLHEENLRHATGAYPFDYDADGHVDLFVMRFGQNRLLKGSAECTFTDVTADLLPQRSDWTTAFAALRSDDGIFRTWVVGAYVKRDQPLSREDNCDTSYFLAFDGDGLNLTPFPDGSNHCPLSLVFVDLDGDDQPELRVANDRAYYAPHGTEQIFSLNAEGAYEELDPEAWRAPQLWGMGLAWTQLAEGQTAVSITNMAENHLHVVASEGFAFENQAFPRGVASQRPYGGDDVRPSTSWHNQFADFNGDGLDDLLIIKGNVDSMPQFAAYDPDSLLMNQGDGTWVEGGDQAGIETGNRGRGAGVADFNGDGCLDILVVNRNEPASLHLQTNCRHPIIFTNTQVGGGHAGGGWLTP